MTVRAQRVDACRNRDRLLEVAAEAFAEQGVDTSLEKIAKAACVGIGTLYRHYPTRDALVEAVYRHNVDLLCERAEELSATLPPDEALAAWMQAFVTYVASKKGLATYLKSVVSADSDLFETTLSKVRQTVDGLIAAAAGLLPWASAKAGIAISTAPKPAPIQTTVSSSDRTAREASGPASECTASGCGRTARTA